VKLKFYLTGLALAATLAGCGGSREPKAQDAAAKAVDGAKDFTIQKKDAFLAAMGQKMKDLDAQVDELGKKTGSYKDDAKTEADKAMAALRGQRDALGKKYDALKKTGGDTWESARAGVASAWSDLEKAYENAKSRFN
jgi:hypothetical protein